MRVRIEHGDCVEVLGRLAAEGVVCDSCVTDPPYHMTSTLRRFSQAKIDGGTDAEKRAAARSDASARLSRGFMGQKWDGGDVAFRKETWEAVYGVLRPGAFLLAFGGTRTYHRLACAIEDAGFVVQDMVAWLYGSGFPKNRGMLKPALEPVCLAYKPGGKRTLQVEECRIGTDGGTSRLHNQGDYLQSGWRAGHGAVDIDKGRWPADICHDGSDEVVSLLPDTGAGSYPASRGPSGIGAVGMAGQSGLTPVRLDAGSAARFFYTTKADKDERQGSGHPTVKPTDLMQWLVRLVTPLGGTVIDPFAGTGSTGAAAYLEGVDSILIERDDTYIEDLRRKMAVFQARRVRTLY